MAIGLKRQIDAEGRKPIINAAPGTASGELVTYEQLNAAVEGLAWKDSVRAASVVAVTLAAPGATIDAITLTSGDRVLIKNQASVPTNGIYIFNGAATPLTRAPDASTFAELESAVVTVEEGTLGAGTTWRQTQVNGVIETNDVIWGTFGTSTPVATETLTGTVELATQAETDTGTDDTRAITPLKMATYSGRAKRFSATFGDGAATSYVITHNLNTLDVIVMLRETGGSVREVLAEIQHTSVNSVTVLVDAAPALNSLRATVLA